MNSRERDTVEFYASNVTNDDLSAWEQPTYKAHLINSKSIHSKDIKNYLLFTQSNPINFKSHYSTNVAEKLIRYFSKVNEMRC